MKRYFLLAILALLLVPSAALYAERDNELQPERQMELRRMELEIQEREAEIEFRQQMREIELDERRAELEHERRPIAHARCAGRHCRGKAIFLFGICLPVHILMAIWVYQDARKRTHGSGIWIVVTLLTGLFGALVYAVSRIGDAQQEKK